MLSVEMDEKNKVAILKPTGALSEEDFMSAAKIIDPYIEGSGSLNGLIIHAESFPGWDSFSALCSHLKFVKDHHKKISRLAFSIDSVVGQVAEKIASHFVNAEVKVFSFDELELAKKWVNDSK